MNNVPETARICKVVHSDQAQEPYLVEPCPPASAGGQRPASKRSSCSDSAHAQEQVSLRLSRLMTDGSHNKRWFPCSLVCVQGVVTARGAAEVCARLQELNLAERTRSQSMPRASSLRSSCSLSRPSASMHLDAVGSPPSSSSHDSSLPAPLLDRQTLVVNAPIAALQARGGSSSTAVRLQLLDTPGPNEAGEEELRHQVERLLGTVDAAVYLLDYTKLKTTDEALMLDRLKEVRQFFKGIGTEAGLVHTQTSDIAVPCSFTILRGGSGSYGCRSLSSHCDRQLILIMTLGRAAMPAGESCTDSAPLTASLHSREQGNAAQVSN